MSKSFASAMAMMQKRPRASQANHSLSLLDEAGAIVEKIVAGENGVARVNIPASRSWHLFERSGDEVISIDLALEHGAKLVWLNARQSSQTNIRNISVRMGRSTHLIHRESLHLLSGGGLGQSWRVDFDGPDAICDVATRVVQDDGSSACLAYDAKLDGRCVGSEYLQVARTMRVGTACSTLVEPNLVVKTSQVKARHGASHGRIDPLACHALMARGFNLAQARTLLTQAFLSSAWDGLSLPFDGSGFMGAAHG